MQSCPVVFVCFTFDSGFVLPHRFIKLLPDKITIGSPFYSAQLPLLRYGEGASPYKREKQSSRQ